MGISLSEYREKLTTAFPPAPFFGLVSECDEGIALRHELPGKCWTEVSSEFIDFNSGSLPLLTDAGLRAFLPAWLMRSAERLDEADPVLSEFTMYFLCPGSFDEGWEEERIADYVEIFNAPQRNAVRDFLLAIVEDPGREYWHDYAEFGLKWWTA